jgi:murein L,D-transpeptidase YcbB/YkuD
LSKRGFEPAEAGEHDVWLTYLYLKYASDLADGLSDLARADAKWQIRPEKFDPAASLEDALARNRIEESLRELTPDNPQYLALRRVLAEYRTQAAGGGWPTVPANLRLAPGQKSRNVRRL